MAELGDTVRVIEVFPGELPLPLRPVVPVKEPMPEPMPERVGVPADVSWSDSRTADVAETLIARILRARAREEAS